MSDLERRLARLERAQASGGVVFRVMPPDLEGAPEARACWTEEQRAALPQDVRDQVRDEEWSQQPAAGRYKRPWG